MGDKDMMEAGGPNKRTDIGATEKREGLDEDRSVDRRQTDADTR